MCELEFLGTICPLVASTVWLELLEQFPTSPDELFRVSPGQCRRQSHRWPRVEVLCVNRMPAPGSLESHGATAAEGVRDQKRFPTKLFAGRVENGAGHRMRASRPPSEEGDDR